MLEAPLEGAGRALADVFRFQTYLGGGRVRPSAGLPRPRPVHRESFVCVVGGRSPPTTHTKQFSPGRNHINQLLLLVVEYYPR